MDPGRCSYHLRQLLGQDYWSRELKNEQVRRVLSSLQPSIMKRLEMKDILPVLSKWQVLTEHEMRCLKKTQPTDQAFKLVDFLKKKGMAGIQNLYVCLMESSEQPGNVHYQLAVELKQLVQAELGITVPSDPAASDPAAVSSTHQQRQDAMYPFYVAENNLQGFDDQPVDVPDSHKQVPENKSWSLRAFDNKQPHSLEHISGEDVSQENCENKDHRFSPNSVDTSSPRFTGIMYNTAPAKVSKFVEEYEVAKKPVVHKIPYTKYYRYLGIGNALQSLEINPTYQLCVPLSQSPRTETPDEATVREGKPGAVRHSAERTSSTVVQGTKDVRYQLILLYPTNQMPQHQPMVVAIAVATWQQLNETIHPANTLCQSLSIDYPHLRFARKIRGPITIVNEKVEISSCPSNGFDAVPLDVPELTREEIDLRSVNGVIPAHIIVQIECVSTGSVPPSCRIRMSVKGVEPQHQFQPLLHIAPAHTSPPPPHKVVALNPEVLEEKVLELLPSKWKELGSQLGISEETLQDIGSNYNNDILQCCRTVLMKWKQSSNGAHQCHILLNAIANMGEDRITQYLYKYFQIPLTKI